MAQRDLNFSPSVTRVEPEGADTSIIDVVVGLGAQLAEASAQSKALKATADTQVQFRRLDAKFRQEYADDPTNADGLQQLSEARKQVVSDIGKNVPSIVMRDYTNKTIELGQQSNASNELWAGKQQARNAISNLKTASTTYLQQANTSGQDFGRDGGELQTAMNYLEANASIHQFADPVIGKDKADEYLKTFNADYVKAFVSGVAEKNPQKAAAILEDPLIATAFTTKERGDMADLIKRTQRQQELGKQLQTTVNNSNLPDIVNSPELSYFEKRAEIDRLDMQGAISPKAAASARRVIKSSADLDAQTDTPVMADIIKRTYDLNSNTTLRQSEYLVGVQALQEEVLAKQDAGLLTGQDAVKLNKEISTLTQKRVSEATKAVGYTFSAANKKFDALPPQFRGQATRQLFYAQQDAKQQGMEMTPTQLSGQADTIIDGINKQRRSDALAVVSRTADNDAFLKATGYSMADVEATAKKRGLTHAQVIQALRSKYAKQKGRPKPVVSTGVEEQEPQQPTSDAGIKLEGLPPEEELLDDDEE